MAIEDYDEDLDDSHDEESSAKPIIIVGILGLAALLAIATAFMLMKDSGEDPGGDETPAVADATPEAGADPLADLLSDLDTGILDTVDATPGGDEPTPTGTDATPADVAVNTDSTPADIVADSTPAEVEESTPEEVVEETTPEPTPEPVAEATPEPTTPAPGMSYDRDYLASLSGKAGAGGLSGDEVNHLKAIPSNDSNYSRALALVAAHYEAKRDYKGHCEVTKMVLGNSRWKYNPDWNIEQAKCALRNGQLTTAISAADTAISYQVDLASNTRAKRVLLAYQIKARARTAQYEADAKANAGFGDPRKLEGAISGWREVKNYASGVGDSSAASDADREIADLEARRPAE